MDIKVNIYVPNRKEFDGFKTYGLEPDQNWSKFVRSEWAWIVQTYAFLRNDIEIAISNHLVQDSINLCHVDDYTKIKDKDNYFVISVISDRKVYFPSDINVVQNKLQIIDSKHRFITHWPQPGLIKSKRGRGKNEKFNLCFMGIDENTVALDIIKNRNVNLVKMPKNEWNDYSLIDGVVAIRDFCNGLHPEKPASKLINAWHAGVCFIGGPDSAYTDLGKKGEDYIQVITPEDLNFAIDNLLSDTGLREKLIINGFSKAKEINRNSIKKEWLSLFESVYRDDFSVWLKKNKTSRKISVIRNRARYELLRIRRRIRLVKGNY